MNIVKGLFAMLTVALMTSTADAANKAIVVYFSHAGENYGVGNVAEGNTAKVAKEIARRLNADIYEIKEVKPYPTKYDACVGQAKEEQRRNARPAIAGQLPNLSSYKVVFIGYPIWFGDCPMIIYSFLEKENLNGKIIIPFCTHEGSGLGKTAQNLQRRFPRAKVVQKGLAIKGSIAQRDPRMTVKAVEMWLKALKIVK
jgi:flavodoxin